MINIKIVVWEIGAILRTVMQNSENQKTQCLPSNWLLLLNQFNNKIVTCSQIMDEEVEEDPISSIEAAEVVLEELKIIAEEEADN